MKFSLTLPIILSALYIPFCQAAVTLPPCAATCAKQAGTATGCDPCVFSIRILPRPDLTNLPPTHIAELILHASVPTTTTVSSPLQLLVLWRLVARRMLKRRRTIGTRSAATLRTRARVCERGKEQLSILTTVLGLIRLLGRFSFVYLFVCGISQKKMFLGDSACI